MKWMNVERRKGVLFRGVLDKIEKVNCEVELDENKIINF